MVSSSARACAGLVLAAGAGRRMGLPKALVAGDDGVPWLERATGLLLAAGCDPVLVVLGAEADAAAALLPDDRRLTTIVAAGWSEGMGASLKAGLSALAARAPDAEAVVITLVDLPGLNTEVLSRIAEDVSAETLRQATFEGRPGHPVVVGRAHWPAFADSLGGDVGGRAYLLEHCAVLVECADLADGRDVDTHAHSPGPDPTSS